MRASPEPRDPGADLGQEAGRTVVGWALVLVASTFTVYMAGLMRAPDVGWSWRGVAGGVLFGGPILASALHLQGALTRPSSFARTRGTFAFALSAALLCSEGWFQVEELWFRARVRQTNAVYLAEARWAPFSDAGLLYHHGEFSAHD